jgi:hypothetical protein
MIKFFIIPPGSRSAFTPLGNLRRAKLLRGSRACRAQRGRFIRSAKEQKEVRELSRSRGRYFSGSSNVWSQDVLTASFVHLMQKLDDGLSKPNEQIGLEYWHWQQQQEPRRFPRSQYFKSA